MIRTTLRSACVLLAAGLVLAAGCGPTSPYRPFFDEGGSGASIDEHTYISRPHEPKTVTVVDTRTEEVIFSIDVPVGQQLVINFDEKSADRDKYMSGTMRWAVMEAGNRFGSLSNRLAVPPPHSRRVDWFIRSGPEVSTPPAVEVRTPPPLSEDSGQ